MHSKPSAQPNYFSAFMSEIVQDPKYGIAKSEDIHGQPHVVRGEEAEKLSQNHSELLLFETERKWEFSICFFFLPWFREIPSTLKLIAAIKKPDMDHCYPPQIMCFDPTFFDHLEIMKANGIKFDHKMSDITTDQMTMGYIWNSARGMYEPVFREK
jgi:hypothetical protein